MAKFKRTVETTDNVTVKPDENGDVNFEVNGYVFAWLDVEDGKLHLCNGLGKDDCALALDNKGCVIVVKQSLNPRKE